MKCIPLNPTAQEVTRVLEALWQEPRTKTKYIFLITSQWACVGVRICVRLQGKVGKDAKTLLRAPPCDESSGPEPESTQESFKITVIQCTVVPVPDTVLSAAGGGTLIWTSLIQTNHKSLCDIWRQSSSEAVPALCPFLLTPCSSGTDP